jgi:LuxR family transcriptional regulator, quorum-sensing system regulator BjaR1
MGVGELIDGFEAAKTLEELQVKLQLAIENFGFAAYNFFDAGKAHLDLPFYFGTTGLKWEAEYKSNNFVVHDHILSFARRTNIPFKWGDVPLPTQLGKKKPGGVQLLEAAHDHGFEEGYILPFHFVDNQGRGHTALVALFWKDEGSKIEFALSSTRKHELNLLLLYWVQRVLEAKAGELEKRSTFTSRPDNFSHLTDREREALTWAGRGLNVSETSDVLGIGQVTVKTYLLNAMAKLEATNKTHAVAKAVHLGLVDL